MAISQTMSNPSDWMFQSYQNNFPSINQIETPVVNTDQIGTPTTVGASSASRYDNNLSPDQGRVAKPIRRRSRTSSRTPTTVLNTDATNFRAMVQHYTGAPTAPFAMRSRLPSSAAGAGATATATAAAPTSGIHVQYPNQLQQQHMFMIGDMQRDGGRGGPAPPGTSANENQGYNNYML